MDTFLMARNSSRPLIQIMLTACIVVNLLVESKPKNSPGGSTVKINKDLRDKTKLLMVANILLIESVHFTSYQEITDGGRFKHQTKANGAIPDFWLTDQLDMNPNCLRSIDLGSHLMDLGWMDTGVVMN